MPRGPIKNKYRVSDTQEGRLQIIWNTYFDQRGVSAQGVFQCLNDNSNSRYRIEGI